MDKRALSDAAKMTADWMIRNQVESRLDANKGRCLGSYDQATRHHRLTASWETGCLCMALLAANKRFGDDLYLHRAELAGRYIMSLQNMDHRVRRQYGVIREITPQSLEFCPRDATTAAWGLVWLHNVTKNPEYLDRATLFAEWHMEYGMHDGWPLHGVIMDGKFTDHYARGGFQSGTGLFYYDLFMASGDCRYIERGMKPIAQNYRDHFFKENGRIIQHREVFSNKEEVHLGQENVAYNMHEFNDDFGNAMLQTAADTFEDESYREKARQYAHWLISMIDENHEFDDGRAPSGIPVSLMYFHDLGEHYQDETLLDARDEMLEKLLSMQHRDTGDPKLDGAFKGAYHGPSGPGAGELSMNMRTTQYALIALLKLESDLGGFWLSRHNDKFIDPLRTHVKNPYQFIW